MHRRNPQRSGPVSLAVSLFLALPAPGSPVISEFMARNENSIKDSDGDRSDWIEIRNSSPAAIGLGGYSLTDDASNPTKWKFPNQSLAGGAYLLVFASGKDRRPLDGELHTNFSLDGDGEYLGLFSPGGLAAETVFDPFPPQIENLSYGEGASSKSATAIHAGAACRWHVPTSPITDWNGLGYNDSSWTAATTGIGYERSSLDTYDPLISPTGDVDSQMYRSRTSAYVRIPFDLEDATLVTGLTLRIKYDDGFAAFINAQPITSDRAPSPLNWNSSATAIHNDAEAFEFIDFPVAKLPSNLVNGQNILAIQGLNRTIDSSDFLIVPELDVVRGTILPGDSGFHTTPTPGQLNSESFDGIVEDTKFSVNRGFYSLPFPVSITTATGDAQIRYTTDGSEPTATSGTIYTTPLTISTTTVLRAAAFKNGFAPTNVDTQTYLFTSSVIQQAEMDPSITNSSAYSGLIDTALRGTLPTVSLATQDSNLFGASGIYTNAESSGRAAEIPISVEYFTPSGAEEFQIDAGVRIHGGNARTHPKKPLRLYFRRDYGAPKLRFPLYPGSPVAEFDQLLLRGGGHDSWSLADVFGRDDDDIPPHGTLMRDQFLRRSEIEMGILSPRGKYVHLYLNGQYWGVYDLHERANEDFFADHGGGEPEDYDVLHHPEFAGVDYSLVSGSDAAWNTMQSLATAGINNEAQYQTIQKDLDIDAFITAMITRMWSGDYDWCGPIFEGFSDETRFDNKNWYAGRRSRNGDGDGDGRFLFFCWDAEMSMGLHLKGSFEAQRVLDFDLTRADDPGSPVALYDALRDYSEFRVRFGDLLQKHLFNGGAMSTSNNLARLSAMEAEIDVAMIAESARWGDEGSGSDVFDRDDEWRSEVNWLKDRFIAGRNARLITQFRAAGLFPTVTAPSFDQRGGAVAAGFQLILSGSGGAIFYTLDGTDPRLAGGAINPEARIYTGPIALEGSSATVRARIRATATSWSPLDEASFVLGEAASADNLTISEFHYHPSAPSRSEELAISAAARDYEFIEVLNTSAVTVTLTGIEFTQGVSFSLDASSPLQELAPGDRMLIVANRDAFLARYGSSLSGQIVGTFADGSKLSNNGEALTLTDAFGQTISRITYSDSAPWPSPADGHGRSLELVDVGSTIDESIPDSWSASVIPGGTPGRPAVTNYSSWVAMFFDPSSLEFDALADPQADPEPDRLTNLIEYALARSPSRAEAGDDSTSVSKVMVSGQAFAAFTYTYQPGLSDLAIGVESSTDLLNWTSANLTMAGSPLPQSDGTEVVTTRSTIPFSPEVPVYFRLSIQLQHD